jgi:hypothetical protein
LHSGHGTAWKSLSQAVVEADDDAGMPLQGALRPAE